MPLGKLREDYVPFPASGPASPLTGDVDGFSATPSPARALQHKLELHTAEQALGNIEKWSPRRALAFIIAASAALWMALILAGAEVARVVA